MSGQHLGIDDEDFCLDVVPRVETSFGFLFQEHDLEHVGTFGEFCDAVLAKLSCLDASDCTSQQAFYKLRKALLTQQPAVVAIEPSTRLAELLPIKRQERRKTVAAVEAELGIKLNVLGLSACAQEVGTLLLLGSGATMFFDKAIGGIGLVFTWTFFYLASKFGGTIKTKTVRAVVEKMSSRFYRQSRRNPATVNRAEITKEIQQLFTRDFGIELTALTPDALLF